MLHRYWFIVDPEVPFGSRSIGVSAVSLVAAKLLLKTAYNKIGWLAFDIELLDFVEVLEDFDVNILDADHVIPNMGVVVWPGVWFPNLNHGS